MENIIISHTESFKGLHANNINHTTHGMRDKTEKRTPILPTAGVGGTNMSNPANNPV